ncbi:unknown [[Mannheimia] succiniciproducens MBEL55E]|uniref:Uncharacterized protein n=1 Tax=Mannheimia succiniciproducens (strain KCTC 0769BP / MBEL55E) TaxID=221988 RepID=Q65W36_MANSM|nr:unknown [[Mannheimia] succiniciproducens MBEL55E]
MSNTSAASFNSALICSKYIQFSFYEQVKNAENTAPDKCFAIL